MPPNEKVTVMERTDADVAMTSTDQDRAKAAWEDLAVGFDAYVTPLGFSIAEDVLDLVDVRGGEVFLDIAAGSGALSLPAARRGADVLATDLSPAMIERLQARAAAEGLGNVEARVMDAYDLDLAADTFDVVASIAGATILPDVGRTLREMVRVTKPGGHAVAVNFGPPERAEFAGVFIGAMQTVIPGFTPPGEGPSPSFQLADPERMRRELADAGLGDVRVEALTWRMEFESGAHLLNVLRFANPMTGEIVDDLTDKQAAAVEEAIDGALRERSEDHGAVLNTECNVGIGTK